MSPTRNKHVLKNNPTLMLMIASLFIGITSGLVGMLLALMLHYIQHLAFGYSPDLIISPESFLEGVTSAKPERRILALIMCGIIAGFGWWLLYSYGSPLVKIADAVKSHKKIPKISTLIHALIQIVTIALGSPLGREVAPREAGAVFASKLGEILGCSQKETTIMIASGAGAALAAVYNVPFGGAVFVLETLLCTYNWTVVIPVLLSSALATLVSWWGLGNQIMYHIPAFELSASLIAWSALSGPIFGFGAYLFIGMAKIQSARALRNWTMIPGCMINFTLIGLLAVYFPTLLGNGKSPVQLELASVLSLQLATSLLLLRCLIVWSSLRVGAQGGLLTPSLANGALLGGILGGLWSMFWPDTSIEAFALIGAAAFLGAAQKMPLTAIVLIFELTHVPLNFLVPIVFAVGGSVVCFNFCVYLER